MNHLDNPQFNRAKNGSLPSFEDIGMKTLGKISNKISITIIFGHKHFKNTNLEQNMVFFTKKKSTEI